MKIVDNLLKKDSMKLTFKEKQVVIDYFIHMVNTEFEDFKKDMLNQEKAEIFERAYLIDSYDNIRIRLSSLSFETISKLLKYLKNDFISYMYEADVNDGVLEYYDDIESRILNEVSKLRKENETKAA